MLAEDMNFGSVAADPRLGAGARRALLPIVMAACGRRQ